MRNRLTKSRERRDLDGYIRQPDHVLVNEIAGYKPERRPGTGEERFAATKRHGVKVKAILIDKAKGWLAGT